MSICKAIARLVENPLPHNIGQVTSVYPQFTFSGFPEKASSKGRMKSGELSGDCLGQD